MGASNYIVKSFSPTELAARIRAALGQGEPSEPYALGDLVVDPKITPYLLPTQSKC